MHPQDQEAERLQQVSSCMETEEPQAVINLSFHFFATILFQGYTPGGFVAL
jgi:hypothetical protein